MGRPCICCNNITCDSSYCINSDNFENHDYVIGIIYTNVNPGGFIWNKYSLFDRDFYLNDVYLGTHKKNTTCQWFTTSLSAIQNFQNYFNSSPPPSVIGYNFDNISLLNNQQKEAFFAETFRMRSEQQGVRNCLNNKPIFEFGGIEVAVFRIYQNNICYLFPIPPFLSIDNEWWRYQKFISLDGRYQANNAKTIQNLCCDDRLFDSLVFEITNEVPPPSNTDFRADSSSVTLAYSCNDPFGSRDYRKECNKFAQWPFYTPDQLAWWRTSFRDSTYILRKNLINCGTIDFFESTQIVSRRSTFRLDNNILHISPLNGLAINNTIYESRGMDYPGFNELYKILSRGNLHNMKVIQDDLFDFDENGNFEGFCRQVDNPFTLHTKRAPFINVKVTGV